MKHGADNMMTSKTCKLPNRQIQDKKPCGGSVTGLPHMFSYRHAHVPSLCRVFTKKGVKTWFMAKFVLTFSLIQLYICQ